MGSRIRRPILRLIVTLSDDGESVEVDTSINRPPVGVEFTPGMLAAVVRRQLPAIAERYARECGPPGHGPN